MRGTASAEGPSLAPIGARRADRRDQKQWPGPPAQGRPCLRRRRADAGRRGQEQFPLSARIRRFSDRGAIACASWATSHARRTTRRDPIDGRLPWACRHPRRARSGEHPYKYVFLGRPHRGASKEQNDRRLLAAAGFADVELHVTRVYDPRERAERLGNESGSCGGSSPSWDASAFLGSTPATAA